MNILVTDDSITMRTIVTRVIRMAGIPAENIFHAGNGAEGLEILKGPRVDLVLADINMPVMDGLEMIEAMKADEKLSCIPVVVISTEGSDSRIFKLRRMGIKAFLRKPFTPENLSRTIGGVLEEKAGLRPDRNTDPHLSGRIL